MLSNRLEDEFRRGFPADTFGIPRYLRLRVVVAVIAIQEIYIRALEFNKEFLVYFRQTRQCRLSFGKVRLIRHDK